MYDKERYNAFPLVAPALKSDDDEFLFRSIAVGGTQSDGGDIPVEDSGFFLNISYKNHTTQT
ncbi:MAG: hypothetical protein LUQ36_05195 [Methanoregula sp.]|jgi:hypothetical protein|nr:hypothetical protein [Methanoregula sp.]